MFGEEEGRRTKKNQGETGKEGVLAAGENKEKTTKGRGKGKKEGCLESEKIHFCRTKVGIPRDAGGVYIMATGS